MFKIWCKCPCQQTANVSKILTAMLEKIQRRPIERLTLFLSVRRILQRADRPVGEVHEPDVHQDLRPALHTELARLPGAVCGAAPILFWLYSALFCTFYDHIATQHEHAHLIHSTPNRNWSVGTCHLYSQIKSFFRSSFLVFLNWGNQLVEIACDCHLIPFVLNPLLLWTGVSTHCSFWCRVKMPRRLLGIPQTTDSIFALRLSCFGTTGSFCLQAVATAAA